MFFQILDPILLISKISMDFKNAYIILELQFVRICVTLLYLTQAKFSALLLYIKYCTHIHCFVLPYTCVVTQDLKSIFR